jgi:lipid-A-disaccharide synthase
LIRSADLHRFFWASQSMLIHSNQRQRATDNGHSFKSGVSKSVVIIAGEASADLHGSNLVTAMKRLDPGIVFSGIGGTKMEQAGVKIILPSSEMAVVGLTEVFSKLRTIFKASKDIKSILKNDRPDLLILIDYPDFNIHIAKTAKRHGIPVLYYISPQVWAWRTGRVRKIARRVDRMAVILPFEKDYYKQRPIEVDYVGHPILDECPRDINKSRGVLKAEIEQGYPIVGLMPGSRKEEIRNLLPVMIDAAEILGRRYPDIQCILPLAPDIEPSFVQSYIDDTDATIELFQGSIYDVLSVCDVALVTSGTATLETAIMGVPMVIVYKISPISYWIARLVVKVPYAGLVNLVGGEEVATELIQDEVTADKLAHEALTILDNTEIRETMIRKLNRIKEKLGKGGASEKTARIAQEMMK